MTPARMAAVVGPALAWAGASTVRLEQRDVRVALLRRENEPAIGASDVLVRVRAFSCNYRDKGLILRAATMPRADGYYVIGSEFAGEIVAIGPRVRGLTVGDRVIGDNAYPVRRRGIAAGIPSNHASREWLVLPASKVIAIPAALPITEAAALSIGAQTAYAMVRRARIRAGDRVLVTAARSSTAQFLVAALRTTGALVDVTTTRPLPNARGIDRAFVVPRTATCWSDVPELFAHAKGIGGYTAAFDPFFDIHLRRLLPLVAIGGCVVTCGFHGQEGTIADTHVTPERVVEALQLAMMRNITIIGNCLGRREDLSRAIRDVASGEWRVPLDSTLSGEDLHPFVERTFIDPDRFGKVVFAYD
jgi:NADPH:quinone reductase-like Zn-dependent oxidoreductase